MTVAGDRCANRRSAFRGHGGRRILIGRSRDRTAQFWRAGYVVPAANIKATSYASRAFDRLVTHGKLTSNRLNSTALVYEDGSIVCEGTNRSGWPTTELVAHSAHQRPVPEEPSVIDRAHPQRATKRRTKISVLGLFVRNFTIILDMSSRYPVFTYFGVSWMPRSRFVPPRRGS